MSQFPPVPPRTTASLYVGDLPVDLDNPENALYGMFNKVGPVMSIKVCRDINSQRSLGYGYVNFQNPQDAERAIETLNFTEIRPGRQMRVMWSSRDPTVRKSGKGNIFVKNLDESMDTRLLRDTFAPFGKIISCKLAQDENGKSLGYGFVHFEAEESATKAIEQVDGMTIAGKKISVELFIKKADREKEEEKVFCNIYVKNLKEDVKEETLKNMLAVFGPVESLFVSAHPQHKTQFALVTMGTHEAAVEVIAKWNGQPVAELSEGEEKLYVGRALKKRDRLAQRTSNTAHNLYQSQGRNVYVKHLDDNITEEKLEELFQPFGKITSCTLMKDSNGNFRGFGFVCFESKESASAAIREMNGKMIFRRPLYVSQAQQRDMRHQMLEDQRKSMIAQQQRMSMTMDMYGFYPGMPPNFMQRQPPFMSAGPFMVNPALRRAMPQPRGVLRPKMPPPMGMMPPQQRYTQAPMPPRMPVASGVSSAELAKMSIEEQKNALGERLYAEIQKMNPEQAAKITGMLLEMDVPEVLHVLEDRNMLLAKINEAQAVLRQHAERH